MPIVAVICEYNLFHNGHARLLDMVRQRFGPDTVILSLMSGNFTQRGIPAATDKYTRAHAALLHGSDLTLELPLPYACAPAQQFAQGAVDLLAALGAVDHLAFGSECGDLALLQTAAERRSSDDFERALSAALSGADADESFLRVRERVYAECYGALDLAPNDQLAVEYLTALRATAITPAVFPRTGGESATAARAAFLAREEQTLAALVPPAALKLYRDAPHASEQSLSRAVLYRLRTADPEELAQCAGMTHALAYRLRRLALESADIDGFFARAATKKYTRARMRRAVIACMLGVREQDYARPAYTLLLSASKRGREALRTLRAHAQIPIYDKGVQIDDPLSERSDALYTLALENPVDAGMILRKSPRIEK